MRVKVKATTTVKPKTPDDDARPRRAHTDAVVTAVHYAEEHPGRWIGLGRTFETIENATSTASCIRRGFLRVKPTPGEPRFALGDHVYLALPATPEVKVEQAEGAWSLSLRVT